MRLAARVAVMLLTGGPAAMSAQATHDGSIPDTDHPHVYPFTNGAPDGWTFGPPHLDVAGGYYGKYSDGAGQGAAFFRLHAQLAVKSRYVQLSTDVQFVPSLTKANPSASLVLQVAPIAEFSHFYASAGVGLITNHTVSGAAAGWAQAQFAFRTPLHGAALFGQLGRAFSSGSHTELLIGLQHPLAPYRAHGLKS
jgi:hypothetical protein